MIRNQYQGEKSSSEVSSEERGNNMSINVFKLPLEREPSIISEVIKGMSPDRRQSMHKSLLNRSLVESSLENQSRARSDIDEVQLAELIAERDPTAPDLLDPTKAAGGLVVPTKTKESIQDISSATSEAEGK